MLSLKGLTFEINPQVDVSYIEKNNIYCQESKVFNKQQRTAQSTYRDQKQRKACRILHHKLITTAQALGSI